MSNEFVRGQYESVKHNNLRDTYTASLEVIDKLNYPLQDLIEHFPAFTGHLTLARFISLYEIYKSTLGVAGHIAEVGVYKGSGSLFFAKLIKLYEGSALTQVHGFDWFKGTGCLNAEEEKYLIKGGYMESQERLLALINSQNLSNTLFLHDLDLASPDLNLFFDTHQHLQFKIVFFDCGIYSVMNNALPIFWERLTPGGIMIFDQYNFELAPGETQAIRKFLKTKKVLTFQNGWMPNAYVIKNDF